MRRGWVAGLILLLGLVLPSSVQAKAVGRFVEVEGRVELMKGGKLPVIPVQVQDEVEPGDAIRTKPMSRALIRFIDDTTLNIAPESRVAIEDYVFDAAKGQRQATLQVFRGLVHTVVTRIFQLDKPDFIMKTHTGVMGVRGTDWYAQLSPLSTDFYNASGKTEVSNIFPEIPGKVTLTGMQFTRVERDRPPTVPLPITREDLQQLRLQLLPQTRMSRGVGAPGGAAGASPQDIKGVLPITRAALTTVTALALNMAQTYQVPNPSVAVYTPPVVRPPTPSPTPTPQPVTYIFSLSSLGFLAPTGSFSFGGFGQGQSGSPFGSYFSWSGSGTVTSGTLPYSIYNYLMNFNVSGLPGQTLTGTMNATASNALGWSGAFSGPVSLAPNGTLTFNFSNGTWNIGGQTYTANGSGTLVSRANPPATYSFSQTYAGYSRTIPVGGGPPYNAVITASAWGQRTGDAAVSPGYFTLSGTGSQTSDTSPFSDITKTFARTMTGSVTGYPGQALTGTYTASGTNSLGWSAAFSGPVTILPDGRLFYSYANGVFTKDSQTHTGRGSGSTTPGTYFSQVAVGSVATTSDAVGKVQTITNLNSYPIWGSRTGVYPGSFSATLNLTNTAPVSGFYPPSDQGSFTAQMQGVVSGPSGGTQIGVMTYSITSENQNVATFAGPVTINPDGSLNSFLYGTNRDPGAPAAITAPFRQQGSWTQTAASAPAPSTYSITASLVASLTINPISTSQANFSLQGWGGRPNTSPYPGTYMGDGSGTLTGPPGSFVLGNQISTTVYGNFTGSVTGILGGHTLTGSGTFTGHNPSIVNVDLPGTVTIQPDGRLIFDFSGGTITFNGQTLTAAGTVRQQYAIPFTETTTGTYQLVSGGGSQPTLLNTGQLTGNRNGDLLAGPVNASMVLNYGGSDPPFPLSPPTSGSITWLSVGAVRPWYAGEQSDGVAINTITLNSGTPAAFMGQMTYDPQTGNLVRQVAKSIPSSSYLMSAMASSLQTPPPGQPAQTTLAFAQEASGNYQLTANPPFDTATYSNLGVVSGTMKVGGGGSIATYPIKANFNLTSTASLSGAFPPYQSGSVSTTQFLGAAAGPVNGTHSGFAMSSISFDSYIMGLGGPFTINTDPSLPPSQRLPATFELNGQNATPSGVAATQTGSWSQTDPPRMGRTAAAEATGRSTAPGGLAMTARVAAAPKETTPSAAPAAAATFALPAAVSNITLGHRLQAAAQLSRPFGGSAPGALNEAKTAQVARQAHKAKPVASSTSPLQASGPSKPAAVLRPPPNTAIIRQ